MAARPALPPGANRILFVKNLNYQITGEDLYDLFGRYGTIRQIRIGNEQKTKGTAFVVFDDVMDAKNALDHLNGFHLQERFILVEGLRPALNISFYTPRSACSDGVLAFNQLGGGIGLSQRTVLLRRLATEMLLRTLPMRDGRACVSFTSFIPLTAMVRLTTHDT
ncbi:RRM domain-containing protein [Mycena venus]|uniref:RRM domain-containing protein n=1 Tax=Mycena venus TaxID=2733690 RepID=A0A8H6Y209_9AGAR|nr:RRM domain-containing protein [Mycena venus]